MGRDGGEYEAPPNSPKDNLQLWMNTLSQSNLNSGCVRVEVAGMLSDSREHLSCLEFSFLSPPPYNRRGAFLWSLQG